MSQKPTTCVQIEPDLIAAATGEATTGADARVQAHVATCRSCRDDYTRYRAVDAVVGTLRGERPPAADADAARARLVARLADLKSRLVSYQVFPSPLGPILIAASEHGIALVEYLRGGVADSRLFRMGDVDTQEGGRALERLHGELLDYLAGRRTRLEWPLDLRFARSDFERAVLQATAAVPYGAVSSYTGIAGDLGKPRAHAAHRAGRHVPLRSQSGSAVLSADVREHRHPPARPGEAVLAPRAGGSDRTLPLRRLPPGSPSAGDLARRRAARRAVFPRPPFTSSPPRGHR